MTLNVQNAKKIGIGGSKNLFDGQMELGIINGNTGQNGSNTNYTRCKNYIPVSEKTSYTISSPTFSGEFFIYEYKSDYTYNLSSNKYSPSTFTTESGTSFVRFRPNAQVTETPLNTNYQFELGDKATAYTPYVAPSEVRAIHDKDSRLLWGRLEYDTKYEGDAWQQTYTGKNIFSFDAYGTFAYGQPGNITQTHTDTSAHMVATGTSGAQYVRTTIDGFDPTKTYIVSCKAKKIVKGTDGQPRLRIYIQYSDDGSSFSSHTANEIGDPVQGQEYTLSASFSGHPYYRFYFYNNSSTPVTVGEETEYWNIQVEESGTATPFEPYVGGIPAPNPGYPQDIKVVEGPQTIMLRGKNKFSFNAGDAATGGDVSQTHTDNSVHLVATGTTGAQYYRVNLGNFNPEKRYWVSCKGKKIVKGTNGNPYLKLNVYYSDNGTSWTAYQSAQVSGPTEGQTYDLSLAFIGHPYYRFYFYNNAGTPVTVNEETEYWDIQVVEHPVAMGALSQISLADSHGIKYWNTNDGRIIANGTSDAVSQVAFTGFYTYKKGRMYTLKVNNPIAPPSGSSTQIKFLDSDVQQPFVATINNANTTYSFTPTEDKSLQMTFRTNSGVTLNNFEIKPVVYDTTGEPFEVYQAKTVSMDLRGVNLMPMDSAIINNDARVIRFKMGLPAGTYTVSYDLDSFEMGTNTSFGINLGLAAAGSGYVLDLGMQTITSSTTLGRYSKTFTITAPVSIDRQSDVRVANTWWTNGARVSISNIQIEVGDTETTYQTYHDPYWLAKIGTFKDYFYKDGDDWKFHHEIIKKKFDGTTEGTWGMYSSGMAFYLNSSDLYKATASGAGETACVYSDYYKNYIYTYIVATTPVVDYGISLYGATTPRSRLNVRNKDCADVTAFTNWLSAHNLTIYAARETASDVVITDAVLIEKLNSIHDWLNRYGYHADVVGDLPIVINQESL